RRGDHPRLSALAVAVAQGFSRGLVGLVVAIVRRLALKPTAGIGLHGVAVVQVVVHETDAENETDDEPLHPDRLSRQLSYAARTEFKRRPVTGARQFCGCTRRRGPSTRRHKYGNEQVTASDLSSPHLASPGGRGTHIRYAAEL